MDKAQEYLLNNVQNGMVGGFSKDPSATPDPFHSFLGIASLALWRQNEAGDSCLPDLDGVDEASFGDYKCPEEVLWRAS